jgi:hypothetical protein
MISSAKTMRLMTLATGGLVFTATSGFTEPAKQEPEPPSFKVLDSQEVDLGSRSIIYNRVETPLLKPQPATAERAAAPATEHVPTPAELEESRRWEALKYVGLYLSCTVYDGRWTEVRFRHEDTDIIFWSTINFNYLSQLFDLLTEHTYYSLMVMVNDSTLKELDQQNAELRLSGQAALKTTPPASLLKLNARMQKSAWRITSKAPVPPEAQLAIEDLHAHFDANRQALMDAYAARQSAQIAHEKWLKDNPPQPQDTVIQFFPIQSDHSPTEAQTVESAISTSRQP